jgi:glutathione S-transferase
MIADSKIMTFAGKFRNLIALAIFILECDAFSAISMSLNSKHTLYDMPVSNNGARCRIILYKKNLDESEVCVVSPSVIGGLKSAEFLALNPQGKMPTLHCTEAGFSIPESDTICRYLLTEYANIGPSFLPENPKSNLLCRFHDCYLTTIQGCLYKDRPPFGIYGTRKEALAEFRHQLQIIDEMLNDGDDYLCGPDVSLADATIFPTMVFAKHMLPKFGFRDALPSKIDSWFERLKENDSVFKRVYDEVSIERSVFRCFARFPAAHVESPLD